MFETRNVPCKNNPLGVKGAGEAGAIGSCPAADERNPRRALAQLPHPHIDMPATPERIWGAIREGKRLHTL